MIRERRRDERRGPASPLAHGAAAALLLCASLAAGCLRAASPVPALADPPAPPAPAGCRAVAAGADLQAAVEAAEEGAALCLAPGAYAGPLRVDRRVALWGPREAVLRSAGSGTTVRVTAPGAALLGFTVQGSGDRYDLQDAAVHVGADDARVEGLVVRDAIFGLVVERAERATIRNNRIHGTGEEALGLRGDAIRLWETYDSVIEGNVVTHSRDIVVWYASRNAILGNTVAGGRYGTHFMYSRGNEVRGNRYIGNTVGVFAMYSRDVDVAGNLFADSGGSAGIGLGLKESSAMRVERNVFLGNTEGIYLDTSPYAPGETNRFSGNLVRGSETAVAFHSSAKDNVFEGNLFRDNIRQVRVDGGGDATGVLWRGNDFDDYAGYDFDGDGVGDVPYEARRLSNELVASYPNLAFLHGAPALAMVDAVSHILPLFRPRLLLVDPAPRLGLEPPEAPRVDRA